MSWYGDEKPLCAGLSGLFDSANDAYGNTYTQKVLWPMGRAICADCPLRQACLDAALWEEATTTGRGRHYRYNLRGGMSPAEREREHDARGLVYLCVECTEAPRLSRGDLCATCSEEHNREVKNNWHKLQRLMGDVAA